MQSGWQFRAPSTMRRHVVIEPPLLAGHSSVFLERWRGEQLFRCWAQSCRAVSDANGAGSGWTASGVQITIGDKQIRSGCWHVPVAGWPARVPVCLRLLQQRGCPVERSGKTLERKHEVGLLATVRDHLDLEARCVAQCSQSVSLEAQVDQAAPGYAGSEA